MSLIGLNEPAHRDAAALSSRAMRQPREATVTTHSPEWYDRQYNARAGIADAVTILRGWAERSADARAASRCELDLPYGDGRDDTERLDVFRPEGSPDGPAPVLLHIHGGYWRSLDKRDQSFIARPFAAAGALVVVPNYALCPAVTVAQIVLQVAQAVAWTWRRARAYGGDERRIVVAGHSAGGHLAAMMLACRWTQLAPDLPRHLVRTAIPVSGLFDLEPLRHAPFLAADLRLDAAEARRLSPAAMPPPAGKRLLPFVGELESDEFHRQGRLIRRAWGAKVVAAPQAVAGCHHLGVMDAMADPSTPLHRAVLGALGLPAS